MSDTKAYTASDRRALGLPGGTDANLTGARESFPIPGDVHDARAVVMLRELGPYRPGAPERCINPQCRSDDLSARSIVPEVLTHWRCLACGTDGLADITVAQVLLIDRLDYAAYLAAQPQRPASPRRRRRLAVPAEG